jgi:hypothetical protein
MIIIIMRGENFVAHLDGLGGTPVCRGTPVAHHWTRGTRNGRSKISRFKKKSVYVVPPFQMFNQLTVFQEIWYDRYAIAGNNNIGGSSMANANIWYTRDRSKYLQILCGKRY